MGLLLVPADKDNINVSIDKSVDISFAKRFLPSEFIDEILKYSGNEGIRCFATTQISIYQGLKKGDEVLLTKKATGLFTHYGIIIGKIQNAELGKELWPFGSSKPWEFIYFLANINKISIEKSRLVQELGYKENYAVSGIVRVKDSQYSTFGTISKRYQIPVYQNISEINTEIEYFGENVIALGERRRGHDKFSITVKQNYNYSCAICGITETEFLVAGHISPWAEDPQNRLNPENGICLCSLHDKAFEHGYIGLSNDFKIIINSKVNQNSKLYVLLKDFENKSIKIPALGKPNIMFLSKHRKKHNI